MIRIKKLIRFGFYFAEEISRRPYRDFRKNAQNKPGSVSITWTATEDVHLDVACPNVENVTSIEINSAM
jgi:hypothetical protein